MFFRQRKKERAREKEEEKELKEKEREQEEEKTCFYGCVIFEKNLFIKTFLKDFTVNDCFLIIFLVFGTFI